MPMQKQLPRDDKMYNINEGYNLKSQKSQLSSKQRVESALSMNSTLETQGRPKSAIMYPRTSSKLSTLYAQSQKNPTNRRSVVSLRREDSPFWLFSAGARSQNNSFAFKKTSESIEDIIPNFEKLMTNASSH